MTLADLNNTTELPELNEKIETSNIMHSALEDCDKCHLLIAMWVKFMPIFLLLRMLMRREGYSINGWSPGQDK